MPNRKPREQLPHLNRPSAPVKRGTTRAAAEQRKAAFVEAYLTNGNNATQAAITAGYSPRSAAYAGHMALKDPKVSEEVKRRQSELMSKHRLNTDDYYRSLAQTLHFDPRKLLDAGGAVKPLHELDDDTAMALAALEVSEITGPDGEGGRVAVGVVKKVRWLDKNAARDQLGKALRLYGDQPPPAVQVNFVDLMRAARERSKRR